VWPCVLHCSKEHDRRRAGCRSASILAAPAARLESAAQEQRQSTWCSNTQETYQRGVVCVAGRRGIAALACDWQSCSSPRAGGAGGPCHAAHHPAPWVWAPAHPPARALEGAAAAAGRRSPTRGGTPCTDRIAGRNDVRLTA
jgi:hypothetical protein